MKNKLQKTITSIWAIILLISSIWLGSITNLPQLVWAEEPDSILPEPQDHEIPTISEAIPDLYFKAINPGYTVDKISNVGEMIEIGRKNSDTSISLAGFSIGYTNSSGNYSTLFEFPENSWFVGETLLLRLASSPGSDSSNITYIKTIAMKASLTLEREDEVIDTACWTGKDDCPKDFKSTKPTTLIRDLETGEYKHVPVEEYTPTFDPSNYELKAEDQIEDDMPKPSQCRGMVFSEILSYYETFKTEQFIEFYNNSPEQILIDGCKIKYKNKTYTLSGIIKPEDYIAYYPSNLDFNLTKNPTNSNTLELIDTDGTIIDELSYPNGQRKATSYAFIGFDQLGEEIWKITFAPTPGSANNYQEFKTCEDGKVLNKATGNCVKTTSVAEKTCKAGYYLNPLTGRCRKIPSTAATTKTCKEGYYLNPETGRCRKIKENKGADYSLTPKNYKEESSFIALYIVIGVIVLGLIYLIYEFRHEIKKIIYKIIHLKKH